MTERDETRTARVRRAPKIGVFIGVGAIVGIIVTVAVTTSFPADPNVGMWATVAYMSLFGVTAGIVLGAIAALIADRVSRRRAQVVTVERGRVTADAAPTAPTPTETAPAEPEPEAQPEPEKNPGDSASDPT